MDPCRNTNHRQLGSSSSKAAAAAEALAAPQIPRPQIQRAAEGMEGGVEMLWRVLK
jgi:hypothetical protein